ncbi:hypothetical protein [Flavobacterium sp. ACAM 123]|uniref:hypothetical protein n=1 Tax=Flavobacterium sp. ACAM 123 TaxID=1189620 RepID=UPI00031A53DA|nr:hypothetical protein [Flavobacterium sp. ACAM 123]
MSKNNKERRRNNLYFCLFFFILCSLSTFAQVDDSGWESSGKVHNNPEGPPTDADPIAAPIDDHLWILLSLGLSLGAFQMWSQKKNQSV